MRRQCIKCNEFKENGEFPTYKNRKGKRARFNRCRVCKAKYVRKHYEKDREKYLERSRAFREENHEHYIEYLRDYYKKNKEQLQEHGREYNRLNRDKANERLRKYRQTPEGSFKSKARSAISKGLRNGSIIRPKKCSSCGKQCKPEAHHTDYSKPLDVVWLCKSCHWKEHSTHCLNEGGKSI